MTNASKDEDVRIESNPVLDHLATFIIEQFIKEDVNSFVESDLLHDLLVYKLATVAGPMMERAVRRMADELTRSKMIDLKQRVGGLNLHKRVLFRTPDQYNALVALFFEVVERHPELVEPLTDESSFENFMILCVNEYRIEWESFVAGIVAEKLALEKKHKLYANRSRSNEKWDEVPTYADYIADRIDELAKAAPAA